MKRAGKTLAALVVVRLCIFCSSSTISFFMRLLDGMLLGLFKGWLSTWRLADDHPGAAGWVKQCVHMGGDDLYPEERCLNLVLSMKLQAWSC